MKELKNILPNNIISNSVALKLRKCLGVLLLIFGTLFFLLMVLIALAILARRPDSPKQEVYTEALELSLLPLSTFITFFLPWFYFFSGKCPALLKNKYISIPIGLIWAFVCIFLFQYLKEFGFFQ